MRARARLDEAAFGAQKNITRAGKFCAGKNGKKRAASVFVGNKGRWGLPFVAVIDSEFLTEEDDVDSEFFPERKVLWLY